MDLCELGRIAVKAREVLDGVQFGIFATIFGNLEADPDTAFQVGTKQKC